MARASLRSKEGTRVHSTGKHEKVERLPQPERASFFSLDVQINNPSEDNMTAMFDSMMRANRAAGF